MSNEPLISVIIPVYNTGALLCQSLDSLLNQTFRDWEAICVDDGSIDGSGDLLDEYAVRDSRIKVVHQPNGGVSSARNSGLEHASAPYITMLDADDYFVPTALEQLYSCMQAHDCDIVCCTMRKEFPDGHIEIEQSRFGNGLHKATPADIYRFSMRSPCCKLYKHRIIEQGNNRFPLNVPICEDDVFVVSYWYYVKSFYMLDKPLYHYVQSESSVLKKLGEGRLPIECYMATLDVPLIIYRYIESNNPDEDCLKQWKTLLFKSQLHILEWMCECTPNRAEQKQLRAQGCSHVRHICENMSLFTMMNTWTKVKISRCVKAFIHRVKSVIK